MSKLNRKNVYKSSICVVQEQSEDIQMFVTCLFSFFRYLEDASSVKKDLNEHSQDGSSEGTKKNLLPKMISCSLRSGRVFYISWAYS